jgi:pyruvate formate lyase activating enzyme
MGSPVYGYLKNPTMVDFPGHLSAVFLVSGCNFRCGFCHNAALLGRSQKTLPWEQLRETAHRFAAQWVNGAVISGGEPTLAAGLPDLVRFLKQFGWAVKLDTNGSRPADVAASLPLLDSVSMDIKAGLSAYPEVTGFDDVEEITRTVDLLRRSPIDYEFRTTLLGPVHTNEQMLEIADMIRGARRYVLQPFVPQEHLPDSRYRSEPRTPPSRLAEVKALVAGCADEIVIRGE